MPTKVGDIFVRAGLDRSEYNKGLGLMEKEGSAVASAIGKKMAVALSVAGLARFAKQCTEAGASLNAMGTIIDASLPHMTAQVDAFAKSAGQAFGLSQTQAKEFVGKFASMAHAMGYTEQQAYAMSTSLAGLAGDVASYYHISQDEAFGKLGAVFTGETESLKSLGVVMTQNALQSFAMSQGINRSWNEMSELEKTSLRYQFILNGLSLAQGDFSKYSDTWSGSLATIRLNWQNFMATVGQGLINILLPLIQVIAKLSAVLTWLGNKFLWLTRLITGKDAEVGTSLDNTFGQNTQDMFNDTGVSLGNVGSGMKGVGGNARKAKKEVQALKREMMGFDRITKLTGKADSNTGTTGASGIGGGGVGGGGVGGVGEIPEIDWDSLTVPEETKDSWDSWGELIKKALGFILDLGDLALNTILKPLLDLVTKHAVPLAFDLLGTALKNIVDLATSFPKWLMDLLTNGDKTVKIDVDDDFTEKWNEIKKLTDISINVGLRANFGEHNDTVADWIVNSRLLGDLKIFVGLDQSFGTVADWLKNNNYIGTISAVAVSLKTNFGSGIATVADWLSQGSIMGTTIKMLVGLKQGFANGASTVAEWLSKSKLLGGLANFGGSVVSGVVQFGVSLGHSFGAGASTVAGWLKKFAWGDTPSKGVALDDEFGKGAVTVGGWLKKFAWGDTPSKEVGLEPAFGSTGKGKKATDTVSAWLQAKHWGSDPKHGIGLSRNFKGGAKKVSSWLTTNYWGADPQHGIGLTPNFKHNGVSYSSVSSWVASYITSGVNAVVNIAGKVKPTAKGGIYKNGRWSPIQSYASGGYPKGSQLFVAREAGAELVGTLGGHTAVMNNDQIVASVSSGVAKAIAGIHFKMTAPRVVNASAPQPQQKDATQQAIEASNRQLVTILTQILTAINAQDTNVYLDGEQIKNNVVKRINNHTRATGQLELIV